MLRWIRSEPRVPIAPRGLPSLHGGQRSRHAFHADADAIGTAVRQRLGAVSTQAVYDVLRALTDAGLVRRIQPAGSVARYEVRVGDNHHHVVCRSCGAISDVDCAVGDTPCLTASDDGGFTIDEAEVVYWGRCPTCSSRPTPCNGRGST